MTIAITPVTGLPEADADGRARRAALDTLAAAHIEGGEYVEYHSRGLALVVGPLREALAAARVLDDHLTVAVVAESEDDIPDDGEGERLLIARGRPSLRGHLGAFQASLTRGIETHDLAALARPGQPCFDVVLDLGERPLLSVERAPVGYQRTLGDPQRLKAALELLPGLVGEFQKPRYFDYRESLCAHGSRGLSGCSRCLDACATDAIRSAGERIEVDPFLCQGCGSCAVTCPSGAIRYAWPTAADLLGLSRRAIAAYTDAGGGAPAVIFHDDESGAAWVAAHAAELPGRVLPFPVEDVGSIGPEVLCALLAMGATDVVLALPEDAEPSLAKTTANAVAQVAEILQGIGRGAARVRVASGANDLLGALADLHARPATSRAATFSTSGSKREVWQRALALLADPPPAAFDLSTDAPFGTLVVDREACTLCLACAAVCPAEAVTAPGDLPRLDFHEARCLQCGLCEQACPEDAIRLRPRLDVAAQVLPEPAVLNEETPFHCVSCGKAFATERLIERISSRLAGHWMFTDDKARRRLEMCDDCRVKDLLADEGGVRQITR